VSKPARIPAFARADALAPTVARQVVKQRVQAAVRCWERVAKRDKPRVDDIHQLRVWSRRAMAAVELFSPLVAPQAAAELLGILNKARKRAGNARDYDVLQKKLDKQSREDLSHALEVLKTRRAHAADKLRKSYRKQVHSGKIQDLQRELPKAGSAGDNGHAPLPVKFGPWFLQHFADATVDFATQLRPAKPSLRRIHPLRIEGKLIRYALEIGLPSLPKQQGKQLYASLEELQEQLGEICDHLAFAEQFRELAADLKARQRDRVLKEAARHDRQAKAGFTKFGRWWRSANGRKKLQQQFAALLAKPAAAKLPRARTKAVSQRRKTQ